MVPFSDYRIVWDRQDLIARISECVNAPLCEHRPSGRALIALDSNLSMHAALAVSLTSSQRQYSTFFSFSRCVSKLLAASRIFLFPAIVSYFAKVQSLPVGVLKQPASIYPLLLFGTDLRCCISFRTPNTKQRSVRNVKASGTFFPFLKLATIS